MIEIILTSSVLILVLVILRRALRGRIDPRVQYALWLLAAARLLIPGTLFTAPVSVLGAAGGLQTTLHETFPAPDDLPEPLISDSMTQLPAAQPAIPVSIEHPDRDTVVITNNAMAAPEITQWVYNWPDVIWKTGMAVSGSALVLSNLTFHLRLRKRRKLLALPSARWSGNLPVYEAEGLPSPCLFGLSRPAIYLNEAAMDAEHPEHILAHEYAHYRHGDHLWSILRSICLVIHWYNPLVWVAAALSRRDCELACDASALGRLGEAERIDYGQTLLGMVSKRTSPAALLHTATTMTAGKRAMKERIALIVRRPRARKITLALVAVLACLLAACTFGGRAEESAGTDPSDDAEASPEVSPLLEFPGLHWNDSVETVMEALGVTEEDFIESGEDNTSTENTFSFVVADVPFCGYTAQYVICRFIQYVGTGSELGLWNVQVSFPDDMEDFGAVREELLRRYGPETENSDTVHSIDSMWQNHLGDRYDRWVELQQQSGVNYTRWVAAADAQTEETRQMLASVEENYPTYAAKYGTWPSFEEFSEDFPGAALTWSSNSMWTPTFNTVYFDGSRYVQLLQIFTTPAEARNAGIVINDVRQGTDPGEWLSLMNYMDWADVRQAAVDAGLDAAEAEQQVVDAIWQYIGRQDIALTQGEYVSILTATAGLTGTPKEGGYHSRSDNVFPTRHGDIVYRLYTINPSMFAYVVLEQLPEEQQSEVLDFFRYEAREWIDWDRGTYPNWNQAPSPEEAIAALEWELEEGVTAAPGEMTLCTVGQSFQFLPVNAYGVYAATYTTSDPAVAKVALNGTVTAFGSGEADITMHFEGAQGQRDFVCHVRCDLEYSSASIAASIRSYVQAGISPREWLLLMGGVSSWRDIAVPPEGDVWHDWISDVQRAIYNYILDSNSRGGTPLTDKEFLTLLTATEGLDGAYSESYAGILYTLYNQDPMRFAIIALDNLSPEQRNETLGLLLYDWGYFHLLDGLPYQERFDLLLAQLEEDQKGELKLSPDALVFSSVGEVRLLQIVNDMSALSYLSWESSDPEVVTVKMRDDDRFELQAVGPGEATITVRCGIANAGEERTLTCSVFCNW